MCRLFSITSDTPVSPMLAVNALNIMKEGHDGSGVGLFLRGLSGPFTEFGNDPILSGIFSETGIKRLEHYMTDHGFRAKYKLGFDLPQNRPVGVSKRGEYSVRVYETPADWKELTPEQRELRLLETRLTLRAMGEENEDMIVFSFWPDVIMIKETGDPMAVAEYLGLDRHELNAQVIIAQGRQNTNYAINLYACHPFFIQGVCSMTNGENTAFIPIRDFLSSQGVPGYVGYNSDSEVFTHILHFTTKRLGLPVEMYKHVITPLQDNAIDTHPDGPFLRRLKQTCRSLIIDGPNCVIGCLPDKTMFMVQDRKKLRPGVVGGKPGIYAFSSEICGLDAAVPDRDKTQDFQPMHLDTAFVRPDRREITLCRQTDPLPRQH